MSKALIIAEKPSVAGDIAKALGGFRREGDYFESEQHVLCSAIGHLVEIAAPEGVEVTRGKWSFAHLPVLPDHFVVRPIPRYEERLRLLTRLIRRKDVNGLINACDAGREGELIFQLIVQHAKAKQPVRRLWLQSMTPAAIRDAFGHLREQGQMQALADAARCRSEADWLVGINGTRAMTAFNSREGGFFLTTVGRVQTPTLAIVVEREERIRRFVARPYQEISAAFAVARGSYEARWFDPAFKRQEIDPEGRAERIWQPGQAAQVLHALGQHLGACHTALARDESKPSVQSPPALFDLTSLQREANARFGFSAKTTLGLAQALYEKHKLLTYPRTDSKHLPEDYPHTVRSGYCPSDLGGSWRGGGVFALCPRDPRKKLGAAQQAGFRQHQGQRPLRHHPHPACAAPGRSLGGRRQVARSGRAAFPCGLLSSGAAPRHNPDHPPWRTAFP